MQKRPPPGASFCILHENKKTCKILLILQVFFIDGISYTFCGTVNSQNPSEVSKIAGLLYSFTQLSKVECP